MFTEGIYNLDYIIILIVKIDTYCNIWINDFIIQMEYAYAAADVVISRSGAMSIAELCVMKKPAVLVPFPFAAEDHQTSNAMNLVNKQAALIVKDNEAKEKLVETVVGLSKDEVLQQTLKTNIHSHRNCSCGGVSR